MDKAEKTALCICVRVVPVGRHKRCTHDTFKEKIMCVWGDWEPHMSHRCSHKGNSIPLPLRQMKGCYDNQVLPALEGPTTLVLWPLFHVHGTEESRFRLFCTSLRSVTSRPSCVSNSLLLGTTSSPAQHTASSRSWFQVFSDLCPQSQVNLAFSPGS